MSETGVTGLSLRDLEYAIAVADLRHFGKAAERCGVSQPALSEQIRKLEVLLRVKLFERSRKGVEVTGEGAAILRQAQAVLREARSLFDVALSHGDPLAGPLRLGVIPTLGPYYLPTVLQSLRGAFPALALRPEEGLTDQILDRLLTNGLDLVLIALPDATPGLSTEALFFEPFQIVAPEIHPIAHCDRVSVEDLRGEDFLLLEEGHCLRDQAVALCGAHPRRTGRFASSLEMLRHMIAAGEGFALLPALSVKDRPDLDGLAAVRPVEAIVIGGGQAPTTPGRTIGLAWRSRDPRSAAFRQLAAFLRAQAPSCTEPAAELGSASA